MRIPVELPTAHGDLVMSVSFRPDVENKSGVIGNWIVDQVPLALKDTFKSGENFNTYLSVDEAFSYSSAINQAAIDALNMFGPSQEDNQEIKEGE